MYHYKLSNFTKHMKAFMMYKENLIAPMDDFWEYAILRKGHFVSLYYADILIGFIILNQENELLHYECFEKNYIKERTLLAYVIKTFNIKQLYLQTYDVRKKELFMDICNSYEVVGIFYELDRLFKISVPYIKQRLATLADLPLIIEFADTDHHTDADWLQQYFEELIEKRGVYLFFKDNVVVGLGEIRVRDHQGCVAYVGMAVSKKYRKQGIGTHILSYITNEAVKRGLKPVCGTDHENLSSQRTILKVGYYPYHRALKLKVVKHKKKGYLIR